MLDKPKLQAAQRRPRLDPQAARLGRVLIKQASVERLRRLQWATPH